MGQDVNSTDVSLINCYYNKLQPNPQFFTVWTALGVNNATIVMLSFKEMVNLRSSSMYGRFHFQKKGTTQILWTILSAGDSSSYELYCPNTLNLLLKDLKFSIILNITIIVTLNILVRIQYLREKKLLIQYQN